MNKVLETARHYQGTIVALIVCVALCAWGLGCQVTTESPFDPGTKITQAELEIEVGAYASKVTLAYQDIEKQQAIRKAILEAGLAYAQGGGVSPLGLASTLAGIMGLGLVVDNRKKDAVIKSKSNALAALKGGTTV
ncbi:MAG: hypothetical protein GQ565_02970 [Candidatus Aegiribacteria sp.]|nr:hypothetical protein [Candidatus Aegiribacteria sp.]